ncbi:CDP-glycerol glycerophosphotransferase family protein [Leucobacter soli]|uniref:CDP-glycerol glycerophosphotransferase family protein n=1 Tax=Leucobacter soli TaxID=2812850 RepID=UPI00361660D4
MRQWSALLHDERLRAACERHGLRPVLLMHPRFQHHRELLPTPAWMSVASYHDGVAELFARTRLSLTDYSSVAFEAAYGGAPTVYFQFDREAFFSGGHSSQPGDYDFRAQGFGPVVESAGDAVTAVAALLDGTDGNADEAAGYAARIAALYPWRDGRNCERSTAAIERLIAEQR